MTLLDIHKLKANLMRHPSGSDILIGQLLEVIVIQKRIIRINGLTAGLVYNRSRVHQRIVKRYQRPAIAVATGMSQLKPNDQIVIRSEGLTVALTTSVQHSLKIRCGLFVQMKLTGIGSAILADGSGFAPNQLGATS